jgi:hypothetical protein
MKANLTHACCNGTLMTGADHSVDIWIQRVTLKHLFYLLSDIMTIQSGHVAFPVFLDFCGPRSIDNHAYTDRGYRFCCLESCKGC